MNKVTKIIISLLIFLIFAPFFNAINAISVYSLLSVDDFNDSYDVITFVIFLSYIITFIPSAIISIFYCVLSFTHTKKTLMWLVPIIGCVTYAIYVSIIEMLFSVFRGEMVYVILAAPLLSIVGTIISTLIANLIVKAKN